MANFDLEKTLRRIEEKVSKIAISLHVQLKEEKPKETWVKVGVIQQLTGWKKHELRNARVNGLIKMRTGEDGIFYLLESLNPVFIKHGSKVEKSENG